MILSRLFKGRLNRRNWAFGLLSFLGVYILFMILFIIPLNNINSDTSNYWSTFPLANVISIAFMISALIFNISLHVRRLHDIGKSGWLLLVLLLPLINIFGFLYLAFKEGENKDNKYGAKSPKEVNYPGQILGYDVKFNGK